MGYNYTRPLKIDIDESTRLLAAAMGLPLVDGVFPTLVLTGALGTVGGILLTGMAIFGGSLMFTIIVNEMAGESAGERLRKVWLVGVGLIIGVAIEAVIAPTISAGLNMARFRVFGAAVILVIAMAIANDGIARRLPDHTAAYIVFAGLLFSVNPAGIEFDLMVDLELVARAVSAALVSVAFGSVIAVAGPKLDDILDLHAFRIGSAIALALIPLSFWGIVPGTASLAALTFAAMFALDI